jgi:hypothetical protein
MTEYTDPRAEAVRILREAEKVAQSDHPYSSSISDQLTRVADRYITLARDGYQIKVDYVEIGSQHDCSFAHPKAVVYS